MLRKAHLRLVSTALVLTSGAATGLAGCDMPPAETLDQPRVLALKTEPATLSPGAEHTLTALLFDVAGPISWSLCAVAWVPTEPLTCPTGEVELGQGNPLTAVLPADLDDVWLKAEPVEEGRAQPAVKRLEVGVAATNPEVTGIVTADGPLAEIAVGVPIDVSVALAGDAVAAELVVSWYTSAGTLEPGRTLASEAATLEVSGAGDVRLIAVVRNSGGGTGWSDVVVPVVQR